MKKIVTVYVCLCFFIGNSQITNKKLEDRGAQLKSSTPTIIMPSFDMARILAEDAINDADRTKMHRFGYEYKVNFSIHNSGIWTRLADGGATWELTIHSKDAKTLNFVFSEYRLPDGATLHLYNQDKSFVLGAYTSKMNNAANTIGTWLADGDTITLEYYVPFFKNQGKLTIGSVVHGYRSMSSTITKQGNLNSSGDCNQDVNCAIGDDFEVKKDILKKSVAMIIVNGKADCTGTLVNNTSNNKAPYLLTAAHCSGDEATWAFRFNWISKNSVCAENIDSVDNEPENYYQTTSGSTLLAKNSKSDMRLIEITGGLDPNWNLTWAGWDRTGKIPEYTVGIHHPSGDIMKISRDNDSPFMSSESIDSQYIETWSVNNWEIGVTEQGSSGSALFDQDGRIIGQLFGGTAKCIGTNSNSGSDLYGRFDVSWDAGMTPDERLSDWLDPEDIGVEVLDELLQIPALNIVNNSIKKEYSIYPIPAKSFINIEHRSGKTLQYELYNVTGQKVAADEINFFKKTVDISPYKNGVYFVVLTDQATGTRFSKEIIINK